MLKFENIQKTIQGTLLLDNVSGECNRGQILGIIGPHDSGKSSLLKLLSGLIKPDQGNVFYDNLEFNSKTLSKISYLPEERGLYPRTSVYDLIMYFAYLRGMSQHSAKIEAVRFMDRFKLINFSKTKIFDLEKQDIQKIEIIIALIHNPDFIFFDEPFKGLDIYNQNILLELFEQLKKDNKVVIVGSHHIDLLQNLCQNLLLLYKGKNILFGNMHQIIYQNYEDYLKIIVEDNEQIEFFLNSREDIKAFKKMNNEYRILLKRTVDRQKFLQEIAQITTIYHYQVSTPSLRDLILQKIPNPEELEVK